MIPFRNYSMDLTYYPLTKKHRLILNVINVRFDTDIVERKF